MMTIAIARLTVRTYLNRMGRFDPDAAQDMEQAITMLIEDAIERDRSDRSVGDEIRRDLVSSLDLSSGGGGVAAPAPAADVSRPGRRARGRKAATGNGVPE